MPCKSCKYWNEIETKADEDDPIGFCNRYPPTVVQASRLQSQHPVTNASSSCGEWRRS